MKVAIAIRVGSPKSKANVVKATFDSIQSNLGTTYQWKVLVSLGTYAPDDTKEMVRRYSKSDKRISIFQEGEMSWASFINSAIGLSGDCDYFIKSHDDIEIITSNFLEKAISQVQEISRELGWISFTDIGWKRGDFSPPVRTGYHTDVYNDNAWNRKKVFQFHSFPDNWWQASPPIHSLHRVKRFTMRKLSLPPPPYPKPLLKISLLHPDMPKAPVICHAPFNHFVMIKMKTLNSIGPCEDWGTKNALLVDEDWGLRCLARNIPNIWIPNLEYFHQRGILEAGQTRSFNLIHQDATRVDELFYEKWGFHSDPPIHEIHEIQKKFKDTMIPWSSYRNTYDWDYV